IFLALGKSHYIFLSSTSVVDFFKKKFLQYKYSAKNTPTLINTGYLKLDKVIKELKKLKNTKNYILLAPTFSGHIPRYNMSGKLDLIINCVLQKGEKIIFRPHPLDLTEKGNIKNIQKIVKKYKDNNNFFFDNSHSYMESYSKAKVLITDLSTTAYTFAYSTLRPIIFFSEKENDISKTELINLCYYKDRNFVGLISPNIKRLLNSIYIINKNNNYKKSKILSLRKKRIKYINVSLDQTVMQILTIIKKYKN
ncbi:CDP-glycerol glycerophosphotransferase family protein, partial [Candidatus Pelagibacter sp.]|nr:CDP-glycerol glycerophosphotransferase family protein [Candidatus Pelagibacter sp.]